jgi:hypothetical protein
MRGQAVTFDGQRLARLDLVERVATVHPIPTVSGFAQEADRAPATNASRLSSSPSVSSLSLVLVEAMTLPLSSCGP